MLNLEIPGFPSVLQVCFPEGRLPVCARCKKNYKTRDMCRSRSEHTDLPWTSVYVCVTLDESCIDHNNKIKNGTFTTRNIESSPYCYKADVSSETLICSSCKSKNYTRTQCRVKNHHRALPWTAVNVVLSCKSNDDPRSTDYLPVSSDIVSNHNKHNRISEDDIISSNKRRKSVDHICGLPLENPNSMKRTTRKSEDIRKIDKSKTFLLEVNSSEYTVTWLDFDNTKMMPMQSYFTMPNQAAPTSHAATQFWAHQRNQQQRSSPERHFHIIGDQPTITDNQYAHPIDPLPLAQYNWQGSFPAALSKRQAAHNQYYYHNCNQEYYDRQVHAQNHLPSTNWYAMPSFENVQMAFANNVQKSEPYDSSRFPHGHNPFPGPK